jgi:hypothetical protein
LKVLVGNPEGKRPLGRPTRRWEGDIRADLREIGWGGVDWIDLAHEKDQWWRDSEHGNELSDSIKCCEILDYVSDCWLLKKDFAAWS